MLSYLRCHIFLFYCCAEYVKKYCKLLPVTKKTVAVCFIIQQIDGQVFQDKSNSKSKLLQNYRNFNTDGSQRADMTGQQTSLAGLMVILNC